MSTKKAWDHYRGCSIDEIRAINGVKRARMEHKLEQRTRANKRRAAQRKGVRK